MNIKIKRIKQFYLKPKVITWRQTAGSFNYVGLEGSEGIPTYLQAEIHHVKMFWIITHINIRWGFWSLSIPLKEGDLGNFDVIQMKRLSNNIRAQQKV